MRKTPRPKVSEIHEISNSGGDRISAPRQMREKPFESKTVCPFALRAKLSRGASYLNTNSDGATTEGRSKVKRQKAKVGTGSVSDPVANAPGSD
jgi:hypothetical protein